jgi:hypothetical protein
LFGFEKSASTRRVDQKRYNPQKPRKFLGFLHVWGSQKYKVFPWIPTPRFSDHAGLELATRLVLEFFGSFGNIFPLIDNRKMKAADSI